MTFSTASHDRRVARIEELLFLTDVYGYTDAEACRELRISGKTLAEYRRYIAEHPGVRGPVAEAYPGARAGGVPAGKRV